MYDRIDRRLLLCKSPNRCDFTTVLTDILSQLDHWAEVIKMTVMTTWVSAGIGAVRPGPTRRGQISALSRKAFRFQGPAPK